MDPVSVDDLEKVKVIDDLLEQYWFFDNLLNRRTRYCHSDPYTSSNSSKPNSPNNDECSSVEKLEDDGSMARSLIRAPSLPPYIERRKMERKEDSKKISKLSRQLSEKISIQEQKPAYVPKEESVQAKGRESSQRKKSCNQLSKGGLQKTQTLPTCVGGEDLDTIQDQESDARLSFLIQEALASSSEITPPWLQASKGGMQFSSRHRHRPPRNSEPETVRTDSVKEMRLPYPNQRLLRKTLSNLEIEDIQGFKDLGFELSKQNLNPALQEKEQEHSTNQDKAKRSYYCSDSRLVKNCAPPVQTWVAKDSTQDMKAQIKFWARAVASNVRQEC